MKNNLLSFVRSSLLLALTFAIAPLLPAQTLSAFNFYGETNGSSSTTNSTGVSSASLALGSGLSFVTKFTNGYSVNPDGPDNLAQAETDNRYISLTITPSTGSMLNLTSLDFVLASFGGSTDLALTDTSNNVLDSGNATTSVGNSDGTNYAETATISLGSGGVTINTPTTFRLYVYGNELTDPNGDAGDDYDLVFNSGSNINSLTINGTAGSVPEPSSYAFLGLGLAALAFLARRNFRRA